MKTLIIVKKLSFWEWGASVVFLLVQFVVCGQNNVFNPKKTQHEYFVRENQIPSTESLIGRDKNGDTILTSYFKFNNPGTNGFQEFTKVYKGTPYFKNAWSKGSFNNINGKPIPFLIAYNIEKGMVYYVDEGLKQTVEVKPDEFSIDKHNFRAFGKTRVYFEVLHDGKKTLLKQHICRYSSFNVNDKSGYDIKHESDFEGAFNKYYSYFVWVNNDLKPIEKKEKFSKLFKENSKTVAQFIEENALNLKNEGDLIKIMKFADEKSSSQ
jgi:hypothetical protein